MIQRVLVLGANGFIGSHVCRTVSNAGLHVIAGVRAARLRDATEFERGYGISEFRAVDFLAMEDAVSWAAMLRNVDAVVNCVGIFTECVDASFDRLHRQVPIALFDACERTGIACVIQISALGADEQAATPFHRSKKEADANLLSRSVRGVVVQPSLVYGEDGDSSALFRMLATLPVLALPGGGSQQVQPVHVEDVAAAILALLQAPSEKRFPWGRLAAVGPTPCTLAGYLGLLRSGMGIRAPLRVITLPAGLLYAVMPVVERLSGGALTRDAVSMLERGNVGNPKPFARVLGREPRAPATFVPVRLRNALRGEALTRWLDLLLRFSIAAVWIVTAIVSLGLYPVERSYELLIRSGVPQPMLPVALYGAALLDLALGVLTLMPRRPRGLWLAQIALIALYTLIITLKLPEFWLHPYGPLTKNLPMLAILYYLHVREARPWTTSH